MKDEKKIPEKKKLIEIIFKGSNNFINAQSTVIPNVGRSPDNQCECPPDDECNCSPVGACECPPDDECECPPVGACECPPENGV